MSILVPTKGFTQLNKEGKPLYEPNPTRVLRRVRAALAKAPGNHITLREYPHHINDPEFATLVAQEMDLLLSGKSAMHEDSSGFLALDRELDRDAYITLVYRFECMGDPWTAAAHLCQEQSTAQWKRVGVDEDLRASTVPR